MITQDPLQYLKIAKIHGTPLYIYDEHLLSGTAGALLAMKFPYGYTLRYAVKANPHPQIIKLFDQAGLHFDASSTYEAQALIKQGIKPEKISLSSQTLEGLLSEVLTAGVLPVATSLHQIELLSQLGVRELAVRVNPGFGSGHSNRTNVGGPSSSFGIWHEYVPQILESAAKYNLRINRLHTHIGSGADPEVWQKTISLSLKIAEQLPDVVALDMGGGYKVARLPGEVGTDMQRVGKVFSEALEQFAKRTKRKLHLEIEPGTFLVANAGTLLAKIEDIVDTGSGGYSFLKLNTGMNDILRPSLYGAQHPISVLNKARVQQPYIVVGHNCESGDILTPAPADPESLSPRLLNKACIGDVVAIGGAGAYCASMRAVGYNSFPAAKEIVI